MSQRTLAGLLAVPLLVLLWVVAITSPLPYVTYKPGLTVDVLAETRGEEIVQVSGHETYRDDGELRMTTIYVTQPQTDVHLIELLASWADDEEAVYPYDAVYAPDTSDEDSDTESAIQMVSSQDSAVAAALRALDYDVEPVTEVLHVAKGLPAHGRLKVRDVLLRVGDTEIRNAQDVVDAVDAAPVGEPVPFVVRRAGEEVTVDVTPRMVEGDKRVGISPGPGFVFPFDVHVDIGDDIGGPSAGLMFALAIYDTLTPGSLTDGGVVAGSGTITADGKVGPIGGIQQKVAGAADADAELFLVPADNCGEALGASADDTRLVRVATLDEALSAIETWVDDPDAPLPTCEEQT
jgi:PDZ domain-containing protein